MLACGEALPGAEPRLRLLLAAAESVGSLGRGWFSLERSDAADLK